MHWAQDRPGSAIETAWTAFDLDSSDRAAKRLLVDLLHGFPAELTSERRPTFLALLTDRQVEPDFLGPAGWHLVLRDHAPAGAALEEIAFERLAAAFGNDDLAIALLCEAPVYSAPAERLLTRLRRWLLLSADCRRYSALVSALAVQASLNGGAWPFDEVERARMATADQAIVAAYLPRPRVVGASSAAAADPITRAVTAQYEGWPYPAWTRITLPNPRHFSDLVREIDPSAAQDIPIAANMLIAGCGTGRQAAKVASRYPDATITAIDVSEASLDYASRQCAALGIEGVQFRKLDLYEVAQLGQQFEAIYCGGVLHHLHDPERGLSALADVLQAGGVMNIMVYSRLARIWVAGARTLISDLVQQSVSDDLLREVRRRFLERPELPLAARITRTLDFTTLAGTYDLLLHRHEDPFDIPRIKRALDRFGLRLLSFQLPDPPAAAHYDAMFPNDPKHCDINSWHLLEKSGSRLAAGNYTFWCRKD